MIEQCHAHRIIDDVVVLKRCFIGKCNILFLHCNESISNACLLVVVVINLFLAVSRLLVDDHDASDDLFLVLSVTHNSISLL